MLSQKPARESQGDASGRLSQLEGNLQKKEKAIALLKKSLDVMLQEKKHFQKQLLEKDKEASELQQRIKELEHANAKCFKDMGELEDTHSQLTTKFVMTMQKQAEIMNEYNKLKSRLNATARVQVGARK